MTRRPTTIAVLVGALALGAAGCGGSNDDEPSTGAAPAATTAAAPATQPAETTAPTVAPGAPATDPAITSGSEPVAADPTTTIAPVAPPAAPEALRFTAPLVGGGDLDLATLADRPVVLWFWAPT